MEGSRCSTKPSEELGSCEGGRGAVKDLVVRISRCRGWPGSESYSYIHPSIYSYGAGRAGAGY